MTGVVTSSDRYAWKQQPCMYLEAENVTIIDDTWVVQNKFNYLYQQKGDGTLAVPPIGQYICPGKVSIHLMQFGAYRI